MSAPSCVSCNKPFPANGQLASLPEGRRIAFDPGQRRVWRICTKCGEWNLLGAEAAGAALPELSARDPKPSGSMRSSRISGDLELLRIDDVSEVEVADLAMAEKRDVLTRAARFAPWIPLMVVVLHFLGLSFSATSSDRGMQTLIAAMLLLGSMYGLMMVVRIVHRLRYRASVSRTQWATGLAPQIALIVGLPLTGLPLDLAVFQYIIGFPFLLAGSFIPWRRMVGRFLPQRLADITTTLEWDAMAIRWTVSPPALMLKPLGRAWLPSDDSARILEWAVTYHALRQTNAAGVGHAHALAASLGVPGVLAALDEWRHDRDDTLTLADVPAVYLVALQLALSRQHEGSRKALAAHEKLLEAGVVATEAEALDRLPEGT